MLARKGDYGVLAQDEFDARDGLLSPPRVARSGQQNVYYFSPTGDIAGDDGSTEPFETPPSYSWWKLFCLSWCPCFVGQPCSAERREDYTRAMRSFCFLISVVDVILMIVAFSLPPHIVPLSNNPAFGPGAPTFMNLGALLGCAVRQGAFWRILTPMYLHSGVLHIALNLLAQLRIGLYLEHKWGWMRLVTIYFTAGIGGSLTSLVLRPNVVSVGASAALLGLIGAYLAEIIVTWERTEAGQRKLALVQVILVIFVSMMLGFSAFIDTSASVGGLAFGFLAGSSVSASEAANDRLRKYGPWSCVFVVLLLFSVALAVFYTLVHPTAVLPYCTP